MPAEFRLDDWTGREAWEMGEPEEVPVRAEVRFRFRNRSLKKMSSGGGFEEDGLRKFGLCQVVVGAHGFNGFTRVQALGYGMRGNAGALKDGPAEGDKRRNEYESRLSVAGIPGEGEEACGQPGVIVLDPFEVQLEDGAQCELLGSGQLDKIRVPIQEELASGGLESGVEEQPLDAQLCFRDADGFANVRETHLMNRPESPYDVRFDQVEKGKTRVIVIESAEHGDEEAVVLFPTISLSDGPCAQSARGDADRMGGLRVRIPRRVAWIHSAVEVEIRHSGVALNNGPPPGNVSMPWTGIPDRPSPGQYRPRSPWSAPFFLEQVARGSLGRGTPAGGRVGEGWVKQ